MTADAISTINRGLQRADAVRWDDCCEWLAAKHELAWAKPQHDQCVFRACGRDQGDVIDVLQVSALRARYNRAGLSLAGNRGIVGRRSSSLASAGHVRSAGRYVQIVDDGADHVRVLDSPRISMAVVDQEPKLITTSTQAMISEIGDEARSRVRCVTRNTRQMYTNVPMNKPMVT